MQASLLGFVTIDYSLSCNRKVRKSAVFTFALFYFWSGVRFLAEILFVSDHLWFNSYTLKALQDRVTWGKSNVLRTLASAHHQSQSIHPWAQDNFGDIGWCGSSSILSASLTDVGQSSTVPCLVTRVFQGFPGEHKRRNKLFDSEICQLTWINEDNIPFHQQL
jgi:hypothetical protein